MRPNAAAVAVALGLVGGCGKHATEESEPELAAAEVTCATVERRDVVESVEVSGIVAPQPKLDAIVSSPVAGRVTAVHVEEGDRVTAGAVLASIEDPALPAESATARAGVASAAATKEAADQELARQARLVESGIGARRDLEEARARARAAAAELDAARARSGLASQQLSRRELRAPHAGVILHVWKRTGESVDGTAATPIVEIADLTNLEVRAQVSPGALVKLAENMAASVHVLGVDGAIDGFVVRVAPAVDPATLLGTVRVRLATTSTLPVGGAATARVTIGHHPGLTVPVTALRRSSVGTDEVVVCESGTAKIRAVTIGSRHDDSAEVTEGVKAGDQIAIDHVLGIDEGQKLTAPVERSKPP